MRSASSDRNQQQEYRDDLLQQCKDVIAQGLSTCNRYDVTIRGLEDVENVSNKHISVRQNGADTGPGSHSQLPIYRPECLSKCPGKVKRYHCRRFQELYRTVVASRSSVLNPKLAWDAGLGDMFNLDTLALNISTLNDGHINRQPFIAGEWKFRKDMPTPKESNLAHLVFCNPGHRVVLFATHRITMAGSELIKT